MFAIPNTFARRGLALDKAEFAVLGIPCDSSESCRSGSRLAPEAVRAALCDLAEHSSPYDCTTGVFYAKLILNALSICMK